MAQQSLTYSNLLYLPSVRTSSMNRSASSRRMKVASSNTEREGAREGVIDDGVDDHSRDDDACVAGVSR